ncbi:MAG: hypothetical protein ACLF0G_12545 [Candidatus Brocadiia bacterium]
MSRRALAALVPLLGLGASASPGGAEPIETAYACIRVVRGQPGEPGAPTLELPKGYRRVEARNHAVASAGEWYGFIQGPKGVARGVRIAWPGVRVEAVIHHHQRLALRREGEAVLCDVPVQAASARAAWSTLAVWSSLGEKHLGIRIEHNHPARRAGRYAEGPWAEGQARACLNYLIACREILRDWGLHRRIAEQGLGQISLMGFESNNPLHGDHPPHWHLIYYHPASSGQPMHSSPGSQVPHFYMDEAGRTRSNSIAVFGHSDRNRVAGPGDPMVYTDPTGAVRLAIDIRPDGGVNIGPAAGGWTYAILPGDDGRFDDSVRVWRRGEPWLRVAVRDDTANGILTIRVAPADEKKPRLEMLRYDPLTGRPRPGASP